MMRIGFKKLIKSMFKICLKFYYSVISSQEIYISLIELKYLLQGEVDTVVIKPVFKCTPQIQLLNNMYASKLSFGSKHGYRPDLRELTRSGFNRKEKPDPALMDPDLTKCASLFFSLNTCWKKSIYLRCYYLFITLPKKSSVLEEYWIKLLFRLKPDPDPSCVKFRSQTRNPCISYRKHFIKTFY